MAIPKHRSVQKLVQKPLIYKAKAAFEGKENLSSHPHNQEKKCSIISRQILRARQKNNDKKEYRFLPSGDTVSQSAQNLRYFIGGSTPVDCPL